MGSVGVVARHFGLKDDPSIYRRTDRAEARELIESLLHLDLANRLALLPASRAKALAAHFLDAFPEPGAEFWTNLSGTAGNPATAATFDGGVLVVGAEQCGCFWVEDED